MWLVHHWVQKGYVMTDDIQARLLDAALGHVPFDGWGDVTFKAAIADAGLEPEDARAVCPRGAVDLAVAYHLRGDGLMVEQMQGEGFADLRYSEKVAAAVWYRLQAVQDKELVRRGMTLFSMPRYSADAARLIWGTADRIWDELGDTSDDINWYSKRTILSGVYSSCVLYWLGDTSEDDEATQAFIDRRIGDVMRFEKFKASARKSPVLGGIMSGVGAVLSGIKAPSRGAGNR